MEGKKKQTRRQTGYALKQKKDVGIIYDKNEARCPLPEIGDKVVIEEKYVYSRRKGIVKAIYKPSDSYLSARGVPIVYEVKEITVPEDPLRGIVYLEAYVNPQLTYKARIDKLRVSIGFYRLMKQSEDGQIDVNILAGQITDAIAEYTPYYRKNHKNDEEI